MKILQIKSTMLMSMKTTIEKYYGREDSQSKEVTNSWDKTQSLVCMQSTDHFYISDLILKLNDFFLQELFPLWWAKWYQFHARAMERKKNLSIIFLEMVEIGIL